MTAPLCCEHGINCCRQISVAKRTNENTFYWPSDIPHPHHNSNNTGPKHSDCLPRWLGKRETESISPGPLGRSFFACWLCSLSVDQIILIQVHVTYFCTSSDPKEQNVVPKTQSPAQDTLIGRYTLYIVHKIASSILWNNSPRGIRGKTFVHSLTLWS